MNADCSVWGQIWTCDFKLSDDLFSVSLVLPWLCLPCLHQCFLYFLMKWQLQPFHSHFSLDLPQLLSSSVWLCCRWGSVPRNLFLALKLKSLSGRWGNLAGCWETLSPQGWKETFLPAVKWEQAGCTSRLKLRAPSHVLQASQPRRREARWRASVPVGLGPWCSPSWWVAISTPCCYA